MSGNIDIATELRPLNSPGEDHESEAVDQSLRSSVESIQEQSGGAAGTVIGPALTQHTKLIARKSVRSAALFFQGSWLPLLTDKIHNSVRSRVLLGFVYLFISAIVSTLVALLIWQPRVPTYDVEFVVPPQPVFEFGVPFAPVEVRITNDLFQGIDGVDVFVTFSPIAPYSINVSSGKFEGFSHRVECSKNLMFNERQLADEPICNREASQFHAVTDATGFASFSVLTRNPLMMAYGAPVDYLIIAAADSSKLPQLQHKYTTAVTRGSSVVVETSIEANFSWPNANGSFIVHSGDEQTYDFVATAMWRSSKPPVTISGGLIPLNLLSPLGSPLPMEIPYKSNATVFGVADVWLRNSHVAGSPILVGSPESSTLYSATFLFHNVSLSATSTSQVFLGFYFLGRTIPIAVTSMQSKYQNPHRILFPLRVMTKVAAVRVIGMNDSFIVQEGLPLQLRVRITDIDGGPVAGRTVFARAASSSQNPSASYGLALLHPGADPKSVLFATGVTEEDGGVTIPNAVFTVGGNVGLYELFVICDGIQGTWGSLGRTFALVNVTSSLAVNSILCPRVSGIIEGLGQGCAKNSTRGTGNIIPVVEVGQPSPESLVLQIFGKIFGLSAVDRATDVPLIGKRAVLLADNPLEIGITSALAVSDEAGLVKFDSMAVAFAEFAGVHRVNIVIDKIVVVALLWNVTYPANIESLRGECAFVQQLRIPPVLHSGRKIHYMFRTVDPLGDVVGNVTVIILLPTDVIPPSSGANFSFNALQTDERGYFNNSDSSVANFAAPFSMLTMVVCQHGVWDTSFLSARIPSYMTLTYAPRVYSVRILDVGLIDNDSTNLTSWAAIEFDANWDVIDEDNPVSITAPVAWGPESASLFGAGPHIEPYLLTGPQTVLLTASFSSGYNARYAGIFVFVVSADFTPFLPPMIVYVPALAAELRILRSGWDYTTPIGDPFLTMPAILVLDQQGNPLAGRMLSAQLGVVAPDGVTVRWLSPSAKPDDIAIAALSLTREGAEVVETAYPVSPPTNSSGITTFVGLFIPGAQGGVTLAMRYCASFDLLVLKQNGTDGLGDNVCVEEPLRLKVPLFYGSLAEITPTFLSTVPGSPLPPITITNRLATGTPARVSACTFRQLTPPPVYLMRRVAFGSLPSPAPGVCFAMMLNENILACNEGTMTILDMLYFDHRTPDGTYTFEFACIGVVTRVITVSVSSQVKMLRIAPPLPPVLALDRLTRFSVIAENGAGARVAGVDVQLEAVPRDESCIGSQCGALATDSVTFASTDSVGVASFSFAFSTGANSSIISLVASVSPRASTVGVRQSCRRLLVLAAQAIGTARAPILLDSLKRFGGPVAFDTVSIVLNLVENARIVGGADKLRPKMSILERLLFTLSHPSESIATSMPSLSSATVSADVALAGSSGIVSIVHDAPFTISLVSIAIFDQFSDAHFYALGGDEAPIIEVHEPGNRSAILVGVPVEVVAVPVTREASPVQIVLPGLAQTDLSGRFTMEGTRIYAKAPTTFRLLFTSRGNGEAYSRVHIVEQGRVLSTKNILMATATCLVFILSPVLLASVPHSRPGYLILSALMTAIFFSGAVVLVLYSEDLIRFFDRQSVLLRAYQWFVLGASGSLAVAAIAVALGALLGRCKGMGALRIFDDEARCDEIFGYTTWLLQVRVDRQLRPSETSVQSRVKGTVNCVKSALTKRFTERVGTIQRELQEPVISNSESMADRSPRMVLLRRAEREERTLWYDPSVPDAVYLPVNFIIVISVTVVVFWLLTLFIFSIYNEIMRFLNRVISFLPNDRRAAELDNANEVFVAAASAALELVIATAPQFAFLGAWIEPLGRVDIVGFLVTVSTYLNAATRVLTFCFVVGICAASLAVVATCVLFVFAIPNHIRRIRRGNASLQARVGLSEGYIGLHLVHFVALHQLVFWPVVAIVFVFVVEPVRVFVYNTVKVIVVTAVASAITQKLIQVVIVGWFLSDGAFFVVRPELYALWHFLALLLGIFSGVAKAVTRYIQALVFMTLLFARIDISIFPEMLKDFDIATAGFNSVIVTEAKNGNPHFLVFATWLITEFSLRQHAQEIRAICKNDHDLSVRTDHPSLKIASEDFALRSRSAPTKAVIKNLMIHAIEMMQVSRWTPLRRRSKQPESFSIISFLDANERERRERIRNRWWLYVLLHFNPSLRKLRKHQLFVTEHEVSLIDSRCDTSWDEGDPDIHSTQAVSSSA